MNLPDAYRAVEVECHRDPIRADLELTRWMAAEEQRRGRRPVVLFPNVEEYPGASILANPYPRDVLLAGLGLSGPDWQATVARRLALPGPPVEHRPDEPGEPVGALLDAVPAVRHRPGDAGYYLTAAVTATSPVDTDEVNLGVYRVQIVDAQTALIFFDPRTDAWRNLRGHHARGRAMPVVLFMGGGPRYMAAAASSLPSGGNDWQVVAQLSGSAVVLAGALAAPVDASYVIRGEVLPRTADEGPFAEFKGFYVDARPAPVLRVREVLRRPGQAAPTIATGRESGLSLTAFQNEYLTYAALTAEGFAVRRVRCPLDAFGEFLTLVEMDEPSERAVEAVMARDARTKVVVCAPDVRDPWRTLSTDAFAVVRKPYYRKGAVAGERLGIVVTEPAQGRRVEY